MASGPALQSKVTRLLKRVTATSRTVSIRTVSRTGGNPLLGVGGLVSSDDVVCDPQPVVELIAASDVADSAGTLQLGDYRLIFSGAVPEDTLKTGMLVYGDEVLKIIKYEPFAFDQTVAAWQVTARAVN